MNKKFLKMKIVLLGIGMLLIANVSVFTSYGMTVEEGNYLVTVTPNYRNPVSGQVEDPGDNEGIGQGMTEGLCAPTGLLEVYSSGEMYLTVRYYLSNYVSEVTFEEGDGYHFSSISHRMMQQMAEQNDGTIDYRMKIDSIDSLFRSSAYIEPMGRAVVYFFSLSNPRLGSGDFLITNNKGANTSLKNNDEMNDNNIQSDSEFWVIPAQDNQGESGAQISSWQGGNPDDPVTGIPVKKTADLENEPILNASDSEKVWGIQTNLSLSEEDLPEGRALIAVLLKDTAGIKTITKSLADTGTEETANEETIKKASASFFNNKNIMIALLTISAMLMLKAFAGKIIQGIELLKESSGKRERMHERMDM